MFLHEVQCSEAIFWMFLLTNGWKRWWSEWEEGAFCSNACMIYKKKVFHFLLWIFSKNIQQNEFKKSKVNKWKCQVDKLPIDKLHQQFTFLGNRIKMSHLSLCVLVSSLFGNHFIGATKLFFMSNCVIFDIVIHLTK